MQTKIFSYQDSQVQYRVIGEGIPVLFIHGFAEDGRIWDMLIDGLTDNYRVIIPDLPGTGSSDLLQGDKVGIPDYAAVLKGILEQESISECCIIGHSMGGYIALAFARAYPDSVRALGLFHSSAYADDEAKKETRRKAIGVIREKGALSFLKTAIPGLFADQEKSKAHIDDLVKKAATFTPAALVQYYEAMMARPDTTDVLKKAGFPILFILGEHDKAVPFEQGLEQSHLPSKAQVEILRKSGHMGMLEERDKSFSILAHFLTSLYV